MSFVGRLFLLAAVLFALCVPRPSAAGTQAECSIGPDSTIAVSASLAPEGQRQTRPDAPSEALPFTDVPRGVTRYPLRAEFRVAADHHGSARFALATPLWQLRAHPVRGPPHG